MDKELSQEVAGTYRRFSFWQDKHCRSGSEFEAKFDELASQIHALYLKHGYRQPIDFASSITLTTSQGKRDEGAECDDCQGVGRHSYVGTARFMESYIGDCLKCGGTGKKRRR